LTEREISKAQGKVRIVLALICIAFGGSYAFHQLSTRFAFRDDEDTCCCRCSIICKRAAFMYGLTRSTVRSISLPSISCIAY
jgi:hypothetical protein